MVFRFVYFTVLCRAMQVKHLHLLDFARFPEATYDVFLCQIPFQARTGPAKTLQQKSE
jgi:hypothetical protein